MIDKIKQAMKVKNYKFFESGDYNLNIIGIRNSDTGSKVTNVFDDLLTVSYKIGDVWHFKKWAATTDPGTKGVKEFHNAQGVARLVLPQQDSKLIAQAFDSIDDTARRKDVFYGLWSTIADADIHATSLKSHISALLNLFVMYTRACATDDGVA